jgi:molybdopterin-guanine dinucleotide biosynthesis protein A
MTRLTHLSAAILAGGRGVRMGGPKPTLEVGGARLIDRAVEVCQEVFERVVVVRGDPRRPPIPGLSVPQLPDAWPGYGALGGIHAALRACSAEGVLVMASDMPSMEASFLRELVAHDDGADVLVPRSRSGLQPLAAVYRRSCLPVVEAALRADVRQIIAFYPDVRVREYGVDDREGLFTNLNTPEDLRRARGLEGAP